MSYLVLARKWRPQRFEDLIGQPSVVRTLRNAIELGRVSHAILFTGARGVGKTTTARLLSKALNCDAGPTPQPCGECSNCREIAAGSSVDVLEVDGASNTKVDEIRELLENVGYRPSKCRYKIYIIDEVHMLSTHSFNALLKTLEEPPEGVIFLFATTEPHKIPETILSRCQRFDLQEIPSESIEGHLKQVAEAESIVMDEGAARLVARQACGSLRDALSLLDQVVSYAGKEVTERAVVDALGLTDRELISRSLDALAAHDASAAVSVLNEVLGKGFDGRSYLIELWERIRDMMLLRAGADPKLVRLTPEERSALSSTAESIPQEELERWFGLFKEASNEVRYSVAPRYVMEVLFLRAARRMPRIPLAELVERLERLESRLDAGARTPGRSTPTPELPLGGGGASEPPDTEEAAPQDPSSAQGAWERVIDLAKQRKPSAAGILLQASKSVMGEAHLDLSFERDSFYASRAQDADFQAFLCELCREVTGKAFGVRIHTVERDAQKSVRAAPDKTHEREALAHPVVKKAVSLFNARVEEVKTGR